MKAEQLFELMRTTWPPSVDLSDAQLVGSDGMLSRVLNDLEEEVSERLKDAPQLVQAAIWPFHQALHGLARSRFVAGQSSVSPSEVDFADFHHFLVECLNMPERSDELAEFRSHNP